MVFWAANFIVVKDIIGILPPVAFTFLRYFLAALALLAILRWSEGEIRLPRPGPDGSCCSAALGSAFTRCSGRWACSRSRR